MSRRKNLPDDEKYLIPPVPIQKNLGAGLAGDIAVENPALSEAPLPFERRRIQRRVSDTLKTPPSSKPREKK